MMFPWLQYMSCNNVIRRFDKIFHMHSHNFSDDQVTFAKAAFSNLIGGISYFYGSSRYCINVILCNVQMS